MSAAKWNEQAGQWEMKPMAMSAIIAFAKRNIGRAVVLRWRNQDDDWQFFRVEAVLPGGRIALTGMCDNTGSEHTGDWIVSKVDEILWMVLRGES